MSFVIFVNVLCFCREIITKNFEKKEELKSLFCLQHIPQISSKYFIFSLLLSFFFKEMQFLFSQYFYLVFCFVVSFSGQVLL